MVFRLKAPPKPKDQRTSEDEDEDEDISDRLSTSDAYMFPIVSLSVANLRLALILRSDWVNNVVRSIPRRDILRS